MKEDPEIVKFLKELFSGFNCLLWIGAVLSFIVYGLNYIGDGTPDPSDVSVQYGNINSLHVYLIFSLQLGIAVD